MLNKLATQRQLRKLGEPCSSSLCLKSTIRHCALFSKSARQKIFDSFWRISLDERKQFVLSHVDLERAKVSSETSRRTQHIKYYLDLDRSRLQVCCEMFHSTLGMKAKMMRTWIISGKEPPAAKSVRSEYCKPPEDPRQVLTENRVTIKYNVMTHQPASQEVDDHVVAEILSDVSYRKMLKENKLKRMMGKEYWTISPNCLSQKPPRQMGATCSSRKCAKSATRHCYQFSNSMRKKLFEKFWQMSWQQKRQYVISHVNVQRTKINSESSVRTQHIIYYLDVDGARLRVCRQMFHSTLAIKAKMVRNWIISGKSQADSNVKKMEDNKRQGTGKNFSPKEIGYGQVNECKPYVPNNRIRTVTPEESDKMIPHVPCKSREDYVKISQSNKLHDPAEDFSSNASSDGEVEGMSRETNCTKRSKEDKLQNTDEHVISKDLKDDDEITQRENNSMQSAVDPHDVDHVVEVEDNLVAQILSHVSYTKMIKENKVRRMRGKEYWTTSRLSFSKMPSRQMGKTCSSNLCQRSNFRHCHIFTESMRREIFENFWQMSWEQKRTYTRKLVQVKIKHENKVGAPRRIYYLNLDTRRLQVCREMFLSTLGLRANMMQTWIRCGKKPNINNCAVNTQQSIASENVEENAISNILHDHYYTNHVIVWKKSAESKNYSKENISQQPAKEHVKNRVISEITNEEYSGTSLTNNITYWPQRQLGAPCSSPFCVKSTQRHCAKFTESLRRCIFDNFSRKTLPNRQEYIKGLVAAALKGNGLKPFTSISYYLWHDTGRLQVCREMFHSTLCVNSATVRRVIDSCINRDPLKL